MKELKDALKGICAESARIKAADEIRERLEHVSELEQERDVQNITKVTIALSQKIISLIFKIYMHCICRNIERLYPKFKSMCQKAIDCWNMIVRLKVYFKVIAEMEILDCLHFFYMFLRLTIFKSSSQ